MILIINAVVPKNNQYFDNLFKISYSIKIIKDKKILIKKIIIKIF